MNYPFSKTCIIIAGPTAVGKTALAIQLAQHFSTRIISADSRQCYKELNIGVAKPSLEELGAVQHYFVNSHSIEENITAAGFESYALQSAEKIFENNNMAVMVGGTGLYIRAFAEGLDAIPPIDASIKKDIAEHYHSDGLEWLQQQIKELDPGYFATGELQNPQRMMRALEVRLSTGRSIRHFQSHQQIVRPFNIIKIGLELPRELLYQRINDRVDKMMEAGLLNEARALHPYKMLNALQTVGYSELFDFFEKRISLDRAIELIKQNSRRYAKRQLTWFKKDSGMEWVDMREPGKAGQVILKLAGERDRG